MPEGVIVQSAYCSCVGIVHKNSNAMPHIIEYLSAFLVATGLLELLDKT